MIYFLKASLIIFSFYFFYLIQKNIDLFYKYLFYSIISFSFFSYCTKFFQFDLSSEIINLRFLIIFACCFIIFFVFNKKQFSKNSILLIVILLNIISLTFIIFINYDAYSRPINDNFVSGNRNPKNFFIFFTFFINSVIFTKINQLNFKKLFLFLIQILICFYIFKYANIYTKLVLLISITFFFSLFILKKKIVMQIINASFFFLFFLICLIVLLLITGTFQDAVYFVYYNFLNNLANLTNVPAKDICWELTIKEHDLDLVYILHQKYPLHCWQFDESYFSFLWELWLSIMLRSYYFTEVFNNFGSLNDILFGLENSNIIFASGIFAHNSFFDLLLKFGIFVFALTILFLFKIFKDLSINNDFYASIFLLSILIAMNLDDYLFGHRFEFTIIIWLIIGLITNRNFKNLKL